RDGPLAPARVTEHICHQVLGCEDRPTRVDRVLDGLLGSQVGSDGGEVILVQALAVSELSAVMGGEGVENLAGEHRACRVVRPARSAGAGACRRADVGGQPERGAVELGLETVRGYL